MPSHFALHRIKQAAIERLNQHIGRLALVDYEETRQGIMSAKDDETVRVILRDATGEEVQI